MQLFLPNVIIIHLKSVTYNVHYFSDAFKIFQLLWSQCQKLHQNMTAHGHIRHVYQKIPLIKY